MTKDTNMRQIEQKNHLISGRLFITKAVATMRKFNNHHTNHMLVIDEKILVTVKPTALVPAAKINYIIY